MVVSSIITATGMALGARRVENEELGELVGSSDEWIRKRTGIEARYFIEKGQTNWGLGLEASRQALDSVGYEPADLDALIFATLSPDYAFPGSGVLLQDALGAGPIPALDIRNQCAGFLYGLSVANGWIRSGTYESVLVVGSEVHSTGLDLSEEGRDVAVLFGDGAGAAILESDRRAYGDRGKRKRGGRVVDVRIGADGSGAGLLCCEKPGSQFHPSISAEDLATGRHFPKMEGRAVFRRAVEKLSQEVQRAIEENGIDKSKVVFIPHQSNQRINELVAQRLGIAEDRVVHTIGQWGNTTAGSVPMALHRGLESGLVGRGDVALLAAFGSGLTWGTAVVNY